MPQQLRLLRLLTLLLSLACAATNSTFAQDKAIERDESTEPPLTYLLKVGDKSISLTEGQTVQVDGTFNNPQVTLQAQSYREFSQHGVSFRYPQAFHFEAELTEPNCKTWRLSGNDFEITYFLLNADVTTDNFASAMIDQFGRENCQLGKAPPIQFGGKTLPGTSLDVTLIGYKMAIYTYRIPAAGKPTKFLVLQDSLDENGNASTEGKGALDLLIKSSKLAP